jgi:hypothetical protein
MSITPQLEQSLAGKYTKEISDFLSLDVKDSKGVLETLQRMEIETMSITPQLEQSLAGKYTKEISDFLSLDVKDSKGVLETLQRLANEAATIGYNENDKHGWQAGHEREDSND